MHEVFISYSTQDKSVSDAVCNHLEAGGVRCWYAPRDVGPGSIWQEALMNAIQTAKIFLLIYSKDYNKSSQVLNELTAAVNAGCFIVPFRIDQSSMGNAFAYYLNSVHWLDAVNPPTEQQIEALYTHICTILQKPANPKTPHIPDPSKKKTKRTLLICAACFAAFLLLLAVFLPAFFSENNKSLLRFASAGNHQSVPQEIKLMNLSLLPNHCYPYYNRAMLADEGEMYAALNFLDNTLSITRTDNGMPYLTGIENVFSDPLYVKMLMRDDRDTIYFIESVSETKYILRSYSKSTNDWIQKEGISIRVQPTEFIHTTAYFSLSLQAAENHSEEIILYIYDNNPEVNCFSKIIRVSPNDQLETINIRQHELTIPLAGIHDPSHSYSLLLDRNHNLKILDCASGELLDLTYQEIVDKYLPMAQKDVPWFSADRRYLLTGENDAVYVWDLSTGELAFTRTFTRWFNIWFKGDHQLVICNSEDASVSIYDLQTKQSSYVLTRDSFLDSPYFLDIPYNIVYLPELDMVCCVSASIYDEETMTSKDMLTLIDMEGNIVAASGELDTVNGSHFADIFTHNNMLFLSLYAEDSTADIGSSIYTYLYRALFTINENGTVVFSEKTY